MSEKITHKITQGMYVLTTKGGGCIVDAVMRVGGAKEPLIGVAIAKQNHSNSLLRQNQKFALSVLGQKSDRELIKIFGFKSSREIDKCAEAKTHEVDGVPVVDDSLGYMVLEKVDAIENETHTLFIGKMIAGEVFDGEDKPMTYAEYQEEKRDMAKTKTEQGKTAWICKACGYIYYGDEVPDDYKCPLCGLGKSFFEKKN